MIPVAPDSALDTLYMIDENVPLLRARGEMQAARVGSIFDKKPKVEAPAYLATSASWRYLPTARTGKLSSA